MENRYHRNTIQGDRKQKVGLRVELSNLFSIIYEKKGFWKS